MKKIFKGKLGTGMVIFATVILAGVAIFTAFRLYQLRQQPVAPNAPSSNPKADEATTTPISACSLSFTISTGTPTATPSGSPTSTPTTTPTPTGTSTPGPSSTPNSCGGTCGSDANCSSGYFCYQGFCRDRSCPTKTDCTCSATASPTGTPSPTQATLPQSGTNWPTFVGTGVGIFIILGSILLAL